MLSVIFLGLFTVVSIAFIATQIVGIIKDIKSRKKAKSADALKGGTDE